MRIRLTRKLAHALNGLDLRPFKVGDVIDLEDSLACMLLREGWAEFASVPSTADDRHLAPRSRRKIDPAAS
jgi:hypothetical protein